MEKRGFLILFVIAVSLLPAVATPQVREYSVEVDPVPATAATASGLNYSTGFEPGEGFPLGYISNAPGTYPAGCGGAAFPCWGHTSSNSCPSGAPGPVCTFSLMTPTIESMHSASGVQHLRLTHDPTTRTNFPGFGVAVSAHYPRSADLTPRPVAPNTVSLDIAISGPGGQNFRIQPQSNSQGLPATYTLFFYTGEIYVFDECGNGYGDWLYTGVDWDTTGAYRNYMVAMDPCQDAVHYYYDGVLIHNSCVGVVFGSNLEQLLVFGDNYPGSSMDVDNVILQSANGCGVCGDGVVTTEFHSEDCEPTSDANCPGRCIPPGEPNECRCAPICTSAEPCPLQNGENGPFMSSSGFYEYSGNSPFVSIDGCGTDFDAVLNVSSATTPNIYNASCSGADGDPTASCYVASGSQPDPCVCLANPGEPILIWMSTGSSGRVPLGSSSIVNVRKKAACAGASVGACCDTNGPDVGCTDEVLQSACTGADKVWIENAKCGTVACVCIPNCQGATCGDDGCSGSCGTCDDGDACDGVETCGPNRTCVAGTPLVCNDGNACNGVETCDPQTGCVPGTPLNCNDGVACNGIETCNPQSGCVAGTPVNCDDGIDCTVDACNEPDGSCSHDDADCAIPTVSEWGLLALALLLLTTAKLRLASPIAKGG